MRRRFPKLGRVLAFLAVGSLSSGALSSGALGQTGPTQDDPAGFVPFATGLQLDEPEKLQQYRSFRRTRSQSYYPPKVDLTPMMPPVGSQGRQGSCVSWAVGYAASSHLWAAQSMQSVRSSAAQISPSSLHNVAQIKIQGPNRKCDPEKGSNFELTFLILNKFGAVSLDDFPYDDKECDRLPPTTKKHVPQSVKQRTFVPRDVERLGSNHSIKRALAEGSPVIVAVQTTERFMKWMPRFGEDVTSVYKYSQSDVLNTKFHGNHAATLVGYDEGRRAYKIMNSWGEKWGDQGFMWIDYDTFDRFNLLTRRTEGKVAGYRLVGASQRQDPPPPAPAPRPAPAPAPKPVVDPLAGLDTILQAPECASLAARRNGSAVTVEGFVKDAAALASLKEKLGQTYKDFTFDYAVDLRPWPQCEVLLTLKDELRNSKGLQIAVAGGSADARLAEDSVLAIRAVAPQYPAYLYLSYVQADGAVVHLVQPESVLDIAQDPGKAFLFGDGLEGRDRFRVSAPFGDELVFAVASASPLFPDARPATENDRDYLTALRQALLASRAGGKGDREISAAFLAIQTHAKAKE